MCISFRSAPRQLLVVDHHPVLGTLVIVGLDNAISIWHAVGGGTTTGTYDELVRHDVDRGWYQLAVSMDLEMLVVSYPESKVKFPSSAQLR